ncbi:DUF7557 family protein [Halopenitus malekzadehii]|nr:antitoxin VapB family protein [Halopenitus malekzadehii]
MSEDTTIRISRDTWKRLTSLKEPGDSHDDVINDLLKTRESDAAAPN